MNLLYHGKSILIEVSMQIANAKFA